MKSPLFLSLAAVLLGSSLNISQAATTFTIGMQAVTNPGAGSNPNVWPSSGNESPGNAMDGLPNKYLNFGKLGTGYIYTSTSTAPVVTGINFITGNDSVPRDPSSYVLYGSNTAVAMVTPGTVYDVDAQFTLISTANLSLPDTRGTASGTTFANAIPYSTYLLAFPTVKDAAAANSMQIGEARLQTAGGNLDNNGVVAGGQIPEPATTGLLALLSLGLLRRRRSC